MCWVHTAACSTYSQGCAVRTPTTVSLQRQMQAAVSFQRLVEAYLFAQCSAKCRQVIGSVC